MCKNCEAEKILSLSRNRAYLLCPFPDQTVIWEQWYSSHRESPASQLSLDIHCAVEFSLRVSQNYICWWVQVSDRAQGITQVGSSGFAPPWTTHLWLFTLPVLLLQERPSGDGYRWQLFLSSTQCRDYFISGFLEQVSSFSLLSFSCSAPRKHVLLGLVCRNPCASWR